MIRFDLIIYNMLAEFIIILVIIVLLIVAIMYRKATTMMAYYNGGARSRFEADVIAILESITGARFDQAHPGWLRDDDDDDTRAISDKHNHSRSTVFELDGYNKEMRVAIEVQGPIHTRHMIGEPYEKYIARVKRDELKRRICARHGVDLIEVDYRIPLNHMHDYLQSRLYDIGRASKPTNYLAPISLRPWERGDQ